MHLKVTMARWIAFDEESTAAAALRTKAAVTFQPGDALRSALSNGQHGIVIMPTDEAGQLTLLRLRPNVPMPAEVPAAREPTGFLGLSDRLIVEQEPEPSRKWWQRILD